MAMAFLSSRRNWKTLQRSWDRLKLTVLCGLLTILVLRGTIGAGKFGTPAKDVHDIKLQLQRLNSAVIIPINPHRKEASRALTEATLLEPLHKPQQVPTNEEEEQRAQQQQQQQEEVYSLGAKISNWDTQRSEFRLQSDSTHRLRKPPMLLVTGSQPSPCDNPMGDHFLLRSIKNKMDYCRFHHIEIFYNMAFLDDQMAGFWSKIPLLRKLMLSHPHIEWFWWVDSDAMFTDMAFPLPMEKYKNHNLVLHGWDSKVYDEKSWIGLNTGSFLIRNCQWSLDLLDAWAPMGPKGKTRDEAGKLLTSYLYGRPSFEADDQSALVYLLATQRSQWGDKVFLENSYYLHGYWAILVDKYEDMMEKNHPGLGDDRWPLITHFVGCKPCGKLGGDYNDKQCFKGMERAFNFADNQVVQLYGFQHVSLSSSKLRKSTNDTDKPLKDMVQRRQQNFHPLV